MATKKSAAQKKSELVEAVEPVVTATSVAETPVEESPVEESPVERDPAVAEWLVGRMDKTCCEPSETCGECLYVGREDQAPSVSSKSYISGLAEHIGVSEDTIQRTVERLEAMQAWEAKKNAAPKPVRLNFWLKQGAEFILDASEICGIVEREGYPETLVLRGGLAYDLATSVGLHAHKAILNRAKYKTWLDG